MAEDNGGFTELVGTEVSSAGEGHAEVSLKAQERHLNPSGTVHGGVISTLIDVSMAEALNTMTEEDEQPFTIQITVNYMKPGKLGALTSIAQVRKGGRADHYCGGRGCAGGGRRGHCAGYGHLYPRWLGRLVKEPIQ